MSIEPVAFGAAPAGSRDSVWNLVPFQSSGGADGARPIPSTTIAWYADSGANAGLLYSITASPDPVTLAETIVGALSS